MNDKETVNQNTDEQDRVDLDDIEFLKLKPEEGSDRKKNMASRRKKGIFIGLAAALVLAVVYFAFVAPMLKPEKAELPELLEGEDIGTDNRIMLFPSIDKSDISTIEIHNANGDYSFTYVPSKDDFYLTDNEILPLEGTVMSNMVVAARHTLSMERVTTEASEDDLAKYGLGADDSPAWYVLTESGGKKHKVFVGDEIVTGTGYYCRYDGRDAVYILDSAAGSFKKPVEYFVSPIITYPTDSKDYYYNITQFGIMKDDEVFVNIRHLDEAEKKESASLTEYEMVEPAGYVPSSTNYPHILQEFCNFVGSGVIYAGLADREITDEVLEKYGVSEENAKYVLFYNYKIDDKVVPSIAYFSDKDENGFYYVYSMLFNTIVYVSSEKAYFLEWDFIDYVDKPLFQRNINDIAEITVESDTDSETFVLEGEGEDLKISQKSDGKVYDEAMTKSFRQYFRKLLTLAVEDYAESTETENCMMTLKITTDAGKSYEYKFYPYSTRRCFYTINGKGEFYVLRARVEKLIEDIGLLHSGGTVDFDDNGT